MLNACSPAEVEYNSNSGANSSMSTAHAITFDKINSASLSAPTGNNEDWYEFTVTENGLISMDFSADSPSHLIFNVALLDSFGRPLDNITTNASQTTYSFEKREAEPDRYFVSIATNMDKKYGSENCTGESAYSVAVHFELPPPPAPVVDEAAIAAAKAAEEAAEADQKSSAKCVPADKCKAGQKCCKPKKPATPAPVVVQEKTVSGEVVSVTPQSNGKLIIKISGIGSDVGVHKGMTGKLHGTNISVNIYSCASKACQATVEASADEVKRIKNVDVVVK